MPGMPLLCAGVEAVDWWRRKKKGARGDDGRQKKKKKMTGVSRRATAKRGGNMNTFCFTTLIKRSISKDAAFGAALARH
jgi:hypothetical protein